MSSTSVPNQTIVPPPKIGRSRILAFSVTLLGLLAISPLPLRAQTIDYGALEQLFGEPVTTSATGSPQRATEVPANMEIITADEIRRSGAYDIPGVLRHVLGVDVMQWNNDNADVGLRGYDQAFSPRVLVLIDGRQVYAEHYGYTPWAALPVELAAIRQIEVIKGPNAALYGFNAVSGVINIVTYSPLYDNVSAASIRGGTQGMAEASAVQTFKFGDGGGLRLSASGRTDNDFSSSVPVSSTLPRAQNDRFALDADSVFRLGAGVQLGLEVTHSVAATNDFDSSYTVAHDHHDTSSVKGGLTADTAYGLWQATVYHNWLSQNNYGALRSVFEFNAQETVAQLQDLFKIGAEHNFRVSLEYRHNEVGTTPFAGASIFYDDYAANAMWDWKVAPVLSLTTALRWNNLKLGRVGPVPAGYPFVNEDWQRTFADINYNVGLVWKASQSDTLRLILSEGEQLPSLANLGAVLLASPVMNITGSPEVEATEVKNYEIDWDRALPFIGGAFRAAGFYEESTEIITIAGLPIPGSGPPPYSSMGNVGNSNAYGAEFSLKGLFAADWRWGLNYRFESVFDDFVPYAQNGTAYVDFAHVTPKHLVKANLGWARGNWEIDGYVYYQSPTRGLATLPLVPGTFLTPVPGYVSADARIAYRLTDWATFSISGQNLLQSKQRQTSGPAVERRIFGTLSVNF